MKKILILLSCSFLMIVILTGCNNKILKDNLNTKTCTKTFVDESGYNNTDTMVIKSKKDKIVMVEKTTMIEMNSQYIDLVLKVGNEFANKINEINGFESKYIKEDNDKIKMYMKVDFSKINENEVFEKIGQLYSESDAFYAKKDITVNDFTDKYLKDYTCK